MVLWCCLVNFYAFHITIFLQMNFCYHEAGGEPWKGGLIPSFFVRGSNFILKFSLHSQKDHLRAEARRSLEIVQPAVPLSQEAEHSLWCSPWHIYVSLYSLVLSKAFGKLSAFCICQGSSLCVLQVYLLFTSCSTNYVTEKISRLYVNDTRLIFHPGEEKYQN